MKFNKILLLGFEEKDLGENEWHQIDKYCGEKVLLTNNSPDLLDHLTNTDCLLVKLGAKVDIKQIDNAPNLKYIGMFGTGYGGIETKYAASKGITVCNISGYSTEGVAELAFGLIIEHLRDIARAKQQASVGDYSEASFKGKSREIAGKIFGVIGFGRIGSRIGEIARNGFEANVIYWSRNRKKEHEKNGIKYCEDVGTVLKESDFLSLNLAYNSETKNFLNKSRISMLKAGAVIINLSPMELVDIDALEERLKRGDITFILDHSDELYDSSKEQAIKFAKCSNCIMYPPIGYISIEATKAKLKMFVDNLENYLNNKPTNKVN